MTEEQYIAQLERERDDLLSLREEDAAMLDAVADLARENGLTSAGIASRMKHLREIREALHELYMSSLNEMAARNLPLEWQDDCPMERARLALRLPKPRSFQRMCND